MWKHFIFSKFNLPLIVNPRNAYSVAMEKKFQNYLSEEWMQYRMDLLERFCFPNMVNQSNQRFIWLCFFHALTPPKVMERIDRLRRGFDNFTPVFVHRTEEVQAVYESKIKEALSAEDRYVITTHFDADDMMADNYVEEVERYLKQQVDLVTDDFRVICEVTKCYSLAIENPAVITLSKLAGGKYARARVTPSLLETRNQFLTLRGVVHAAMDNKLYISEERFKTVKLEKRLWIHLAHGQNADGPLTGFVTRRTNDLQNHFIIDDEILSGIKSHFWKSLSYRYWPVIKRKTARLIAPPPRKVGKNKLPVRAHHTSQPPWRCNPTPARG